MQNEDFNEVYRQARREAVNQAVARLQQTCVNAVDALEGVMNDKKAPASSRVSAAKTVIEMAIKGVELEDLAIRVSELEQLAEKRNYS